jgi:DNA polymerase I
LSLPEAEKFVVIDGNSLLYRAFYALPLLQNRRGEHTNAVYGFTTMLYKLLEEERPDYLAVAFDPPKPSFRVRIDETYKAQREKTPAELSEQVDKVRAILSAMKIAVFEIDDYEADDVIGTLADLFVAAGQKVVVVSGDADLLQLVDDQITVMLTKKGISLMERYDRDQLKKDYGLDPEQIIEFKALKGDPSDNIAGVPGIGDKTARQLLEEYKTIDSIYDHLDQLKPKTAENLKNYRDQLLTGRDLVMLRRDIALDLDLEDCRFREPDYKLLLPLFEQLEFRSLINRLKANGVEESDESHADHSHCYNVEKIADLARLEALLSSLPNDSQLALCCEPEAGRPYWQQPLKVIALAGDRSKGYYLAPDLATEQSTAIVNMLSALAQRGISLLVHHKKFIDHLFLNNNLPLPKVAFDVQLAAYLVDPAANSYDLTALLQHYLGFTADCIIDPKKKGFDQQLFCELKAEAARNLFLLQDDLKAELSEQILEPLLYDLEQPLASVLARMEKRGLRVDADYLRTLSAEIKTRLADLEHEIYEIVGESFNINSPQQLAVILFDKLGLPVFRKTKTGRSTDARVLEELADQHEIAGLLLIYRQLAKLEGTYLTGLVDLVDQRDHKVYTTLNQTSTATGRLSSSDPNLQNIPIRLEEGRKIRRAFIPTGEGKKFLAADYSQVELRILAHLSGDRILVEAFQTGQDIHRRTAAEVNGISLAEVTPLMRDKAKAVNFGIIYGSSDYGLSQGLRISRAEAKQYIDGYFDRYQGVRKYMDYITQQAREKGYVTTILNRRRYLPEINSSNHNIRSFAERMALNTPIQGSAADIIKLAMLKIDQIINDGGFSAQLLLQIHDELLFEIDENELDFFAPLIKREMEEAYTLDVPIQVDLKWGSNWEELKPL